MEGSRRQAHGWAAPRNVSQETKEHRTQGDPMEDGGVMLAALHATDIQLGADPVLSPVLICVISPEVSRAPLKRLLYGAQITDEETEAQSSDVACPRPAPSYGAGIQGQVSAFKAQVQGT